MSVSTVIKSNHLTATMFADSCNYGFKDILLSYINIVGIVHVEKTCRLFRDLTNDNDFRRQIFIRDFGPQAAEKISQNNQSFKKAYIFYYSRVKDIFQQIPCGSLILSYEGSDTGMKLFGLIGLQFPKERIKHLQLESLLSLFQACAFFPGFSGVFVRNIITCVDFHRNDDQIGKIVERMKQGLYRAAGAGNLEYLEAALSYESFLRKLVESDYIIMLEQALESKKTDTSTYNVIRYMLEVSPFTQICSGVGLGGLMCNASKLGNEKVLALIMAHPKYSQVPIEGYHSYMNAFLNAGNQKTMVKICASSKFYELSPEMLVKMFMQSKANYCKEILLNHPKFPIKALGQMYCNAVQACNLKLSNFIEKCKRFDDLPADREWGIGHAFIIAIQSDNMEVVKHLAESVGKMSLDGEFGLKHAFRIAVEKYNDCFVMGFSSLFKLLGAFDLGGEWGFNETLIMLKNKNPRLYQQFVVQLNSPINEGPNPAAPTLNMPDEQKVSQPSDAKRRRTS